MNKFEDLIKSISCNPSVIVRLGAGRFSEYESHKAITSSRIIYVEPDQYLAETATNAAGTSVGVVVGVGLNVSLVRLGELQ